jgi:hypothetical protein
VMTLPPVLFVIASNSTGGTELQARATDRGTDRARSDRHSAPSGWKRRCRRPPPGHRGHRGGASAWSGLSSSTESRPQNPHLASLR